MPYRADGVGYQNTDTSLAAAPVSSRAQTLRVLVFQTLSAATVPLSVEDVAKLLARPYCSVQPRFSELKNDGLIEDSGRRTLSQYHKQQICWRVRPIQLSLF